MSGEADDAALDELLWRELKLDAAAPDQAFVLRVERAVLEEERYRTSRAAMSRRLVSDLSGLAAILVSLLVLSLAPGLRDALAAMDLAAWGALLSLLLLWLGTRRPGRSLS